MGSFQVTAYDKPTQRNVYVCKVPDFRAAVTIQRQAQDLLHAGDYAGFAKLKAKYRRRT
jgi:hypothetical protein